MISQKTIFGSWPQAPNGVLVLQLSKYGLIGGTTINAPRFYRITLDATGAIPVAQKIVANDQIMPEGTEYQAIVLDSNGEVLLGAQVAAVCGPDQINMNEIFEFSTS